MKYIVFDLDETIGHFVQFNYIYRAFKRYLGRELDINEEFFLFDLFPEIFRPGIFKVFHTISTTRTKDKIKVILFTNNQGEPSWAQSILNYIHYKTKHTIFDRVIGAYKVHGILNEPRRTSMDKSYKDLKNIIHIRKNEPVLFFDDQVHLKMLSSNVSYVMLEPFKKMYTTEEIIQRIHKKIPIHKNRELINYITTYNSYYNDYVSFEYGYDTREESVIQYHVEHFLSL